MNTLLLIPSLLKTDIQDSVTADQHPRMDYYALAAGLRAVDGAVDLLDYAAVDRDRHSLVRLVRKLAGRDAALALMGFLRRRRYDAIFTNGENVGIPLALHLKLLRRRPGHVTIGHRLSTGKKKLFFKTLKVHRQMDTIFVYARTQQAYGENVLGIPPDKLELIPFHADSRFYRPLPDVLVDENQICSAGLEWRDYPTLIKAVADLPGLKVKLAAASPWSKHADETANRTLPPNVDACRYEYGALRDLYARSAFVVVPLYENDFQAGVTTILEAMAMGKAVIATRTTGQVDVIVEGQNGLTVAPGHALARDASLDASDASGHLARDASRGVSGWREAIQRLRSDRPLRERIGQNARQWVEQNATLDRWVDHVIRALQTSCSRA